MTIIKTDNFVDAYRARARSADINALSGRASAAQTRFVAAAIVDLLRPTGTLVDVGCGEGSVLVLAAERAGLAPARLIGVLPTVEEVARTAAHLAGSLAGVRVLRGTATATGLPDQCADVSVCNGVFLILAPAEIDAALAELHRITRAGGRVFVGEVPDRDEWLAPAATMPAPATAAPLWRRAWRIAAGEGVRGITRRLAARLAAHARALRERFGRELVIRGPTMTYWSAPEAFAARLAAGGFEDIRVLRHRELGPAGVAQDSPTRWNYIATRP